MVLEENTKAPDFSLPDENGIERNLRDYLGKTVLLYFYPKDDTPGCTTEACSFRDDYSEYEKAGIIIIGVSPDSSEKHKKFKEKHNLPFILLADENHQICEIYGVWGKKKFMGKEYDGVFRTTFLIDAKGMIKRVYKNVKPAEHSSQVLLDIK